MKKVTRNITVDLARRSNTRVVFATQNDLNSRCLHIELTDDGKPYVIGEMTSATVNYKRPDEVKGAYLATVTPEGGIEYTIHREILGVVGQTQCTITLSGESGQRLTSAPFIIDVSDTLYMGEGLDEADGLDLLDELRGAYTKMNTSEIERMGNELERDHAEKQRIENESERVRAESIRADAEDERDAAEQQRMGYYADIDEYLRRIEEIQRQLIESPKETSLLYAYPIGSIYMSVENKNPVELFGGLWERLRDRFLLGAGDTYAAGSMGGASKVALTENEMPEHTHKMAFISGEGTSSMFGEPRRVINASSTIVGYTDATALNSAGKGTAHNNMPPYLTVYMWKRVG